MEVSRHGECGVVVAYWVVEEFENALGFAVRMGTMMIGAPPWFAVDRKKTKNLRP